MQAETSEQSVKRTIQKLQRAVVDGLEDVKAQDIQVFDTEHLSALFERVIIASGTSNRQTRALAASVRDAVRLAGFDKPRIEGEENGEWIIVDCGSAVVHIMQPAIRQYYTLEDIWGEKPVRMRVGKASAKAAATGAKKTAAKTATKTATKAVTKTATKTATAKTDKAAAKTTASKPAAKKAVAPKVAAATTAARKPAAAKASTAKTTVAASTSAGAAKTKAAASKASTAKKAPAKAASAKATSAKATSAKTAEKKTAARKPATKTVRASKTGS